MLTCALPLALMAVPPVATADWLPGGKTAGVWAALVFGVGEAAAVAFVDPILTWALSAALTAAPPLATFSPLA